MSGPTKTQSLPKWVAFSSELSVARGQLSAFAVVETAIACALYWMFALNWMLLLGAIAAPLLLMRSEASSKLGARYLRAYWFDSKTDWSSMSPLRRSILVGVSFPIAFVCSGATAFKLLAFGFEPAVVAVGAGLLGFVGTGICFVIYNMKITFDGGSLLQRGFGFLGVVLGSLAGASVAIHAYPYGLLAGAVAAYCSIMVARARTSASPGPGHTDDLAGTQRISMTVLIFCVPYMVALLIRATLMRIFSTLSYPIEGLKAIPRNWSDLCWKVDFLYPAALLPGANSVSGYLTVHGLIQKSKDSQKASEKFILWASAIMYSIPATAYRWALKSTIWAWWPLAMFLTTRFEDLSQDQQEARTRLTMAWASNSIYLPAGYLAVLVLITLNFPAQSLIGSVLELLPAELLKIIQGVNRTLNIPKLGLAWWGLIAIIPCILFLYDRATRLKVLYKGDLELGRLELLSVESHDVYQRLARQQDMFRGLVLFSAAQVLWWCLLLFAQQLEPGFLVISLPIWPPR